MIRRAKHTEIKEIIEMTTACGKKMSSEGINQWNEHYPNSLAFENDIKREEIYVFLIENTIIGCIVISSKKDSVYNNIQWLEEDGKNYYIHRLAVSPNHQGKGIARRLMDFAESHILKLNGDSVRLDTFSQNLRNQKFYEVRGYTRLGNIYFPKQSEYPFYCYELLLNT